MLFVHGYGGDALGTWSRFQDLLPAEVKCASYDLLFYEYNGIETPIYISSARLRSLLDFMFGSPVAVINATLPHAVLRPNNFAYDSAVIVAHSLGAVIARQALLEGAVSNAAWSGKTKLILFAPAHKGARVQELAEAAIGGFRFLPVVSALWRFHSPLVDQLRPDSVELKDLETKTREAILKGNTSLIADRVIHAEYEKIVVALPFGDDPPPVILYGRDHFSLCKPAADFPDPVLEVASFL